MYRCTCSTIYGLNARLDQVNSDRLAGGRGVAGGGASLVPRPTLAVADGLHHRYARNGSGIQPNKSRSRQFRANSDVWV